MTCGGAGERADAIPPEAVERAAYPIFVGVAKAPWTRRDDDELCPVEPFTKNHARNLARVALVAALPFLRAAHPEAGSEESERPVAHTASEGLCPECQLPTREGEHQTGCSRAEAGSEEAERPSITRKAAIAEWDRHAEGWRRAGIERDEARAEAERLRAVLGEIHRRTTPQGDAGNQVAHQLSGDALRAAHPEADRPG